MAGVVLGKIDTTATQAAFSTGSMTPVAGQTVLVAVTSRKGSVTDIPTLAGTNGFNVTWTEVSDLITGSSNLSRLTVFRGIPSSGTAGTLTATHATNHVQCQIVAVSFDSIDQTTAEGVINVTVGAAASGTLATSGFFSTAGNMVVLLGVARGAPTAFVPDTSPVPDGSDSLTPGTGSSNGVGVQWLIVATNLFTSVCSMDMTSGTNWAAICVELATGVAATGQPTIKRFGAVPGGRQVAPAGGAGAW